MEIKDLKVLICDDSLLVRRKLKNYLKEKECEHIFEAVNGEEAVAKYKEYHPDLVLMDIVMPLKTGIEALKEIRAYDPNAYVVMASSTGTQSKLKDAIIAGASDFLQKPFEMDTLGQLLSRMTSVR
ncbi:MAG: response regulator [Oscillospiraceae bacterium]|nr:response regulator [Oscillospiraceae bacterium]